MNMPSLRFKIISCIGATLLFCVIFLLAGGLYGFLSSPGFNLYGKISQSVMLLTVFTPLGITFCSIWSLEKKNKVKKNLLILFCALLLSICLAAVALVRFHLAILCLALLFLSLTICILIGATLKKQNESAFSMFVFGAILVLVILYAILILSIGQSFVNL